MIDTKTYLEHQRLIDAGRDAYAILETVEVAATGAGRDVIAIDADSSSGRLQGLRRLALASGKCSMGIAHDPDCRIGLWSYLSTMTEASLYKGIGVVANAINFDARTPGRRGGFVVESGLEVLVDLHILKRLALRLGARDVDSQTAALRPVIAWCAAANQTNVTGRFVVPTTDGLYFCRREALPGISRDEPEEIAARIVTFYSFDEMRASHRHSWMRMKAQGVMAATPSYPRFDVAGEAEIVHLCAMAGEDLIIRTSPQKAV